jgi:dipeptidyl aminopeptidase/acylaminoacyl peptidase
MSLSWQGGAAAICVFIVPFCAFGQSPAKRSFGPADDVELSLFHYAGKHVNGGVIKFSPDGRYFAVVTERGRLDKDAPEDTIWVFRTEEIQRFLQRSGDGTGPSPLPLVQISTEKDGPIIERVRWLHDSTGIAFTAVKKSQRYKFHQLFVADITTRAIKPLTPEDEDIGTFDIRGGNYVYQVSPPELLHASPEEDTQPAVALAGKSLLEILFPRERQLVPFEQGGLWAVIGGKKIKVLGAQAQQRLSARSSLSMSPDGRSVVAILGAEHPPETWAKYKAPPGYDKLHLPVNPAAYHLIDLQSGSEKLLVNAPSGQNQDWNSNLFTACWSADGQSLLLSNTFFPLDTADPKEIAERESHPWIAVLRLRSGQLSGVLPVRAGLDKERYSVDDIRFEDNHSVVVNFDRSNFMRESPASAVFRQAADGSWQHVPGAEDPRLAALHMKVGVRESIDQPPQLVGEDKASGTSRIIWDPNPQLKDIELGSAEVIQWKDESGYEWEAGLLKPPEYVSGKRYPLVVQTHGFSKGQFLSSGIFTTAFAARALAASGFVVVQMVWNPNSLGTFKEGPDSVAGFESLVKKLTDEGIVDPARVGVIGFSRTVYHVLEALTTSKVAFAAASVTDGINLGYFEYLFTVDSQYDREVDLMMGGKPFGTEGLRNWLARSPGFNMDKVKTPLLLLQPGPQSVFVDWEPYAALRYLRKPVDLIMLRPGTHVMTNPSQRLASETINVDWFRFWLQGSEGEAPDYDPDQYVRWRSLCKQRQEELSGSGSGDASPCRASLL